jgi:hypothetical protein
MTDVEADERGRPGGGTRGPGLAWVGVLAGPVAWLIQLVGNWAMGEVVACAPAARPLGSILGLHVNAAAAIVNSVLLAVTVASGIVSLRRFREHDHASRSPEGEPRAWLELAGVMTSVLFAVLIATSFVPIALIGGCR